MLYNFDLWLFALGLIGVVFSTALIVPPLAGHLSGVTGLIDKTLTEIYNFAKHTLSKTVGCTTSCISQLLAGVLLAIGLIFFTVLFGIPMFFVARALVDDQISLAAGLAFGFTVAAVYSLQTRQKKGKKKKKEGKKDEKKKK
ncbi:MAG: hypothetical protein JXB47_19140 [Anaerolineae bacterium]|nr:hypothetical protein [Anaerolineae bacterium]